MVQSATYAEYKTYTTNCSCRCDFMMKIRFANHSNFLFFMAQYKSSQILKTIKAFQILKKEVMKRRDSLK